MNPKRSLLLVLTLAAPLLFAQGTPINGTAQVSGSASSSAAVGGSIVLQIAVDCSGVTGTTGSGSVPVVLGAYQISVTFDKTLVRFESAAGGTSSGFTGAPTATNPSTANSSGTVTITGAQTSSTAPTGNVSVARLTFTALGPGAAAFSTSAVSLSSAYVPPSYGPASIPSTPGNSVVSIAAMPGVISNPVPANGSAVPEPVTLSWTASANTTSYDVYFGTSTPQFLVNTTSTSVPVTTQPGTYYVWRVVSRSSAGTTSSGTFSFTTTGEAPCSTPPKATFTAPANATSGTPFTLSWNAVAGATDYRVDESSDPSFLNATTTTVTAPTRQLVLTKQVAVATTLYFRVIARNRAGSCDVSGSPSATATVAVQPLAVDLPLLRILPAVTSGGGNNGSFFRTALQLHNPTATRMTGTVRFHPAGVSGRDDDPSLAYTLEPAHTIYHADLVAALGAQGLGSLDLIADPGSAAPRATARVFNDGGDAGTTGMFEPLLSEADALTAGDTATLIAPPDPIAARYNLGIRTLTATTLIIELRNSTGTLLTTVTKNYPATYFEQVPASALFGMTPGANDVLSFHLDSGAAFIYGAATDNRTQDPSMEFAQ